MDSVPTTESPYWSLLHQPAESGAKGGQKKQGMYSVNLEDGNGSTLCGLCGRVLAMYSKGQPTICRRPAWALADQVGWAEVGVSHSCNVRNIIGDSVTLSLCTKYNVCDKRSILHALQ